MAGRYLMALDAGGGSGRCLILNCDSGETFTARRAWSHPGAPGTMGIGYDLDPVEIWTLLGEAAREAMVSAGASPGEVVGISASSMRNTTVLVGGSGEFLFGAPNQDARGLGEAMGLAAERGDEVFELGGHWPGPIFTGSRLLWIRNNSPDVLERAASVMSLSDWIGYRLTGTAAAEKSQSGETLLFDIGERDWAWNLIDSLGLPGEIFPRTVDAGTAIGVLTDRAAAHLGVKPGVVVSAGGPDTQCGLLGAGCVSDGDIGVIAGTTMPVQRVTAAPMLDGEGCLWSGLHAAPGLWVIESNGMITGSVLDWFARILFPGSPDPTAALFDEAAGSEPGGGGVYSTFGARLFDARTTSVLFGNLTMSHMVTPDSECRCHICRALLEGIAYSARANLEQIESVAGEGSGRLHVLGGMARSPLWTGIVSDVTGMTVVVPAAREVTALGAAVCAGVGSGLFDDIASGSREVARTGREHTPGPDAGKYGQLYEGWRQAYDLRGECDGHMAGLLTVAMLERGTSEPAPAATCEQFSPRMIVTAVMDDAALAELRGLGEVDYRPWREQMKIYDGGEELASLLDGFQVFITEMDIVDFDAFERLADLRAVVSCRVNPVNVDLESATAFGVPVMNTPGRNADAVADLTVAFMIMLARKLPEAALFLKAPGGVEGDLARMAEAFALYRGRELWRKSVGLVGFGSVGRRVAERLAPFGASVLFYDPAVSTGAGAGGARRATLEEVLEKSDFVSVHAPAVEATRGMIGRAQLALMKDGSFFINTARSSLVDSEALAEALESGHLAGAALDVFDVEPPGADDRLASMPNVIATPHIGGNTGEIAAHQGAVAADQLSKLLCGREPEHLLNPGVLEGFSWTADRPLPPAAVLERLARRPRPTITS